MNLIKVIGVGSPFGDDQAGWKVIDRLKQQIVLPSHLSQSVKIESYDRPGVRLIEYIKDTDTLFLIDAIKSNQDIGSIHRFSKKDILESKDPFSTHHLGVLEALQLGLALNDLPNNVYFYGIEIDMVLIDSTLSQLVHIAVETLALQLKHEIECLLFG